MAGQGTAALELHQQVGQLDVFVVPMSGGGLMAGCASAMRQLDPNCDLIGVEPANADDTRRSFAAGVRVTIDPPVTIADGLAVTAPGAATFEINRQLVSDVVTVTDDQLVDAMRIAADLLGRRLEPSGVAGIAAVLDDPDRYRGRRVGIVLSGGNIDDARFSTLTASTPPSAASPAGRHRTFPSARAAGGGGRPPGSTRRAGPANTGSNG